MKKLSSLLLLMAICCGVNLSAANVEQLFDFDWKFSKGECAGAEKPTFNDSKWQNVDLPHDWSIEGPFDRDAPAFSRGAWLPTGKCGYRKSFTVSRSDAANKRFEIHFEGAYRNSEVWINGEYLGKRPFGFIAFNYDMTPHIKAGENIITVKLDNSSQPGSRWYTGTGIYRHVYLKISDKLYIPTWGNYIIANKVKGTTGVVEFETTVNNDYKKGSQKFSLRHTAYDADGKEVATVTAPEQSLAAGENCVVKSSMQIKDVRVWNGVQDPYLYNIKSEIVANKKTIYEKEIKTGIRTLEYSSTDGLILNGERVQINGVCLHHDGGALGAAVYRRTVERQMEILKEMGANAIRLSHNPSSEEFLQVCDEQGMLVMAEAFDEWLIPKAPSIMEKGVNARMPIDYYAKIFEEWSERDLTAMVMHDRNHPSVFMWSIGNEIHEMKTDAGYDIGMRLKKIVRGLDYRLVTNGVNGYSATGAPNAKSASVNDVRGYNYIKSYGFNRERELYPDARSIVTESSSVQSRYPRGVYLFGNDLEAFYDNLGYKGTTYATLENEKFIRNEGLDALRSIKERKHVMGMFIWTGFDYLAEVSPYGWPARSSSFAPIDLCGFPKDGYYIYQSQWSDKPMVYAYPHWNFEGQEGQIIPVHGFSNGQNMELFVNGKSLGQVSNDSYGVDYSVWYVPYEPGELRIVTYKHKTKEVAAEYVVHTAGEPSTIEIKPDSKVMEANSQDLIYLECNIVDKDGNFVPTANNMLEFTVSGEATLIGVDNGSNMCLESFKGDKHSAFSGKCLAIIKSTKKAGKITVTVNSNGLKSQSVTLESK